MRLAPQLALFVLLAGAAACDKKPPAEATPTGSTTADPGAAKADPVAKEDKPAPKPAKPAEKTGILDLQLQEVDGGYKLITPRMTQFFTSKPAVQRQDTQTPDGAPIPGAVAIQESGDQFSGLIYIPIPDDITYDVKKGIKGARDGMLTMFEGKYDARDEKAKLGPMDATHVIADGHREGQSFHVEAWIAWDEPGRTVYGLMALRLPTDLDGISKLRDGFALRDDAPKAPVKASDAAKKAAAAVDPSGL